MRSGKVATDFRSLPISPMSEGWLNTGSAKVASVMKTSHGTGSNGGQVGIGPALVVARDDDALALAFQHDLRGAEDVAGRHELNVDLADAHGLAVLQRLLVGVGHVLEARAHDGERLGRRHAPRDGPDARDRRGRA